MVRSEKVIIFNGPKAAFDRYISEYYKHDGNNYNLTQLVNLSELERQTHLLKIEGHESSEKIEPSINIDLLYISNNEYSGVTEAVINNFVNYIAKYNITKMIIQNPPIEIINDLKRQFNSKDIHIHNFKYKNINLQLIKTFKKQAPSVILGQEKALTKVSQALLIQKKLNYENKPIVIMLYGPSGVGKTETGRLITKLLGEKIFYCQFSMFQSNSHYNYLYGDTVQLPSLAKDLLNRDSNIIFLDEFDKANSFVYSALYELFDTGKFEDKNFHVDLKNTVIICTSNYESQEKILEHLGAPMFFRINCFIKYEDLSNEVKIKLIEKNYSKLLQQLSKSEQKIISESKIKDKYIQLANKFSNARQIENFLRNEIARKLIETIE